MPCGRDQDGCSSLCEEPAAQFTVLTAAAGPVLSAVCSPLGTLPRRLHLADLRPALWNGPLSSVPGETLASQWVPCGLITGPSCCRLFSLEVPVPPKIFLSMVYKLEGPSAVGVALELTTGDAGSCHVGGISALTGEGTGWPLLSCRPPPSQGTSWAEGLERFHRASASWGCGRPVVQACAAICELSCSPALRLQSAGPRAPRPPGCPSPHPGSLCSDSSPCGFLWTLLIKVLCLLPAERSSRRSPRPLRVPPTKLARWVGRCGQRLSGGWVQR